MMSTKKLVKVEGADMLSPLPTLLHPSFSDCVVYLSCGFQKWIVAFFLVLLMQDAALVPDCDA